MTIKYNEEYTCNRIGWMIMKTRIISAIVLIAILVPLIFIGGLPFSIAVGIIGLLSYKEIIDLNKKNKDLPSIIKIIGAISLLIIIYFSNSKELVSLNIPFKYIAICLCVYLIPTILYGNDNRYTAKDAFNLIGWTLLLGIFYNIIIVLVNEKLACLIYLLLITILNDSFALIFGKLIGSHKLIPSVSPNKTIEGSLCGLVLGSFVAIMYYINIIDPTISLIKIIIITVILSIIGQCGDLVFSKIKREYHIKDFSKLIPGHGGILDRFDSLLFVVLVYIIIISFI